MSNEATVIVEIRMRHTWALVRVLKFFWILAWLGVLSEQRAVSWCEAVATWHAHRWVELRQVEP
jgi:hypothetical protein